LCYYPFVPEMPDRDVLKNHAVSGIELDGRIEGARWVTGRWAGKQSLLFGRDGDCVKLEVSGAYRQMTVFAWIYLDRCDYPLNSIFASDGWRPGALHLQVTRSRDCFLGHWDKAKKKRLVSTVPYGRWTHVAGVADLDRLETRTYVNGELAEEVNLRNNTVPFTPSSSRLGDWFPRLDPTTIPQRGFRGRMDEFALLQRALTQEEIREIVVAGSPAAN